MRGRDELDAERILRTVGLALGRDDDDEDDDKGRRGSASPRAKTATRSWSPPRSTAGRRCKRGSMPTIEIVALDGFRVESVGAQGSAGGASRTGDTVRFTIFRRDELRDVEVTLGEKPVDKFKIKPAEKATETERAAYRAWLGEDWQPPED